MPNCSKVECVECEKKFFVQDEVLPKNIKPEEAFPQQCPFCQEGNYAILQKEE